LLFSFEPPPHNLQLKPLFWEYKTFRMFIMH
jgi:hypothetical protein